MKSKITPIAQTMLRVAVFLAFPVLIIFGLSYVAWPSIYLTAPILFPYAPYSTNLANYSPTIFHTDNLGLWFFAGHSLLIAILVALFSRAKSWAGTWFLYGAFVAFGALLVHIGLHILGFQFFMETP